jgi:hypothetical protein
MDSGPSKRSDESDGHVARFEVAGSIGHPLLRGAKDVPRRVDTRSRDELSSKGPHDVGD